MGFIPILSSDVKKCQQAFLAPLPGMGFIPILSSVIKKCQHTQANALEITQSHFEFAIKQER
jgi:hypothetical protein